MLLIEEGEDSFLPENCQQMHNICVILYDSMVDILKSDGYDAFKHTSISLADFPKDADSSDTARLFEWLIATGRTDELTTVLTKHITCSILSDFLQFVHESLSAAKKSRFSVAYSLARKPFLDELLLFEQILGDNKEFINRLYLQGSTGLYDPSSRKLDKAAIIEAALNKLPLKAMFNKEFIYELRYDKSVKYGLNWITNQGLHIVTTDPNYRTSDRGLNFVFSTEKNLSEYAFHYYHNLLYLLFYTADIIDTIAFAYLPGADEVKHLKAAKRIIALMLYNTIDDNEGNKSSPALAAIASLIQHTCKMCGTDITFELADFEMFVLEGLLLCPACATDQFADREFRTKIVAVGGGG
jgi:hypothetical protein